MKEKTKVVLLITVIVVVSMAFYFLYRGLSQRHKPILSPAKENQKVSDRAVPDFTVLDANGNKVTLHEKFGKPLLINFWASWCGPCQAEFPAMQELMQKYGDKVEFMMVNLTDGQQETIESAKAFMKAGGYTFPLYFDTQYNAAANYNVMSIPTSFFVKADGSLLDYRLGKIEAFDLEGLIKKLLSA